MRTNPFDPYHRWLAIPRGQRPPTFYQLLGVVPTEDDPEVIEEAALRQASHVRAYQTGPHAEWCTAILNEIGQARATLVNADRRREYDAGLTPPSPPPAGPAWESVSAAPSGPRRPRRGSRTAGPALGLWAYAVLLLGAWFLGYSGMPRPAAAGRPVPPKKGPHDRPPGGRA
ncbi:MAG: hypothetical protein ACRC33_31070 [Gemmataceae bacterium]